MGVPERAHRTRRLALRNALIPVLAVIGVTFAWSLGNAILVETVFSRPGLGSTILKAILARDTSWCRAAVLVLAAAVVLLNTALDLIYGARPQARPHMTAPYATPNSSRTPAARRRATLRRYARHPAFVSGAIGVVRWCCVAVLRGLARAASADAHRPENTLSPPSATYWLGTDAFGPLRAVAPIWGTRISLQVGSTCADLAHRRHAARRVAGYVGGWLERVLVA